MRSAPARARRRSRDDRPRPAGSCAGAHCLGSRRSAATACQQAAGSSPHGLPDPGCHDGARLGQLAVAQQLRPAGRVAAYDLISRSAETEILGRSPRRSPHLIRSAESAGRRAWPRMRMPSRRSGWPGAAVQRATQHANRRMSMRSAKARYSCTSGKPVRRRWANHVRSPAEFVARQNGPFCIGTVTVTQPT